MDQHQTCQSLVGKYNEGGQFVKNPASKLSGSDLQISPGFNAKPREKLEIVLQKKNAEKPNIFDTPGTACMIVQISIIAFTNGWKHLEIGYYKIAAPIFFSLSLYFFVKAFLTLRKIEENMAQMILEGIKLEIKTPMVGIFFHWFLQSFGCPTL